MILYYRYLLGTYMHLAYNACITVEDASAKTIDEK